MADFTLHNHDTTTSSSSSSSMGGMDMSSTSTSAHKLFHVGISDSLYVTRWTPTTKGQYAGTVIFLIALAFLYRFLAAYRGALEHRWEKTEPSRGVIVADSDTVSSKDEAEKEKTGAQVSVRALRPWRWSVDLPRSALAVLTSGVGYLLMLAVMTFNVGYFLAVLGGIFAGELVWGRRIKGGEH